MNKKHFFTVIFVLLMVLHFRVGSMEVKAAASYNASAALSYAKGHWNDGKGKCAEFVSDCIKQGGSSCYSASATSLFNQLKKSGMGQVYELSFSSGQTIYMPNYKGKISAGDPVFYYCASCDDGKAYCIHVVLCNGADVNGYMKAYSHNNSNSGTSKYSYLSNCYDCGRRITKAYVYHFNSGSSSETSVNREPLCTIDEIKDGKDGTVNIEGWAFDPDDPGVSINVHIYIGGAYGTEGVEFYNVKANQSSPDVNAAYGINGSHRFSAKIKTKKRGKQKIYFYAIDTCGGHNKEVGTSGTTITSPCTVEIEAPITVKVGESKTVKFSFNGDGIHDLRQLGGNYDDSKVAYRLISADGDTLTGLLSVKGVQEGKGYISITFLDGSGKQFFEKKITVNVEHVHSYDILKTTKEATCTTAGEKRYYCSCGIATSKKVSIPATGHSGGAASCKSQATCIKCGQKYGSVLSCKFDTSKWIIDVKESCEKNGCKSHHCVYCGAKKDITVISATGHRGGTVTCTSLAKCTLCGKSYGSYAEHNYKNDVCTVCGAKKNNKESNGKAEKEEKKKSNKASDKTDANIIAPIQGELIEDEKSGSVYEVLTIGTENTVKYADAGRNAKAVVIPAVVTIDGIKYKVTEIDEGAFEGNRKITRVIIGSNVSRIGESAFKGCTKLSSVIIGENVTVIEAGAFSGCKKLVKVTIPSNVKSIEAKAFYGCRSLKSIAITSKKLQKVGENAFANIKRKAKIKVPENCLENYTVLLKKGGLSNSAKIKK